MRINQTPTRPRIQDTSKNFRKVFLLIVIVKKYFWLAWYGQILETKPSQLDTPVVSLLKEKSLFHLIYMTPRDF